MSRRRHGHRQDGSAAALADLALGPGRAAERGAARGRPKALEPGGSISKRAEEVRKLLVYNEDPNTPHELPDGDGQETAAAADGQSAAVMKALDALRDALLEQK